MHTTDAFIKASVWHGSLTEANALLASHPSIAESNIYTAALLGNDAVVRRFLDQDPGLATAKGGPLRWDALTHLCFSRYLRLHPSRSFVDAAEALIKGGADVNTGFFDGTHTPHEEWESALYGAAGVAFNPDITKLLLDNGADPNDNEVPYHSPETYDNRALRLLLDSGKLTADSLAMMLVRKADFHDTAGLKLVLETGGDPNRMTMWDIIPLHQAVRRDNALENVVLLLDHGADPTIAMQKDGRSSIVLAAHRGRGDLLQLFRERGFSQEMHGADQLIAACAMNEPAMGTLPEDIGGTLLAQFAGNNNAAGIRRLLDFGIPVDARYVHGDAYFGIPKNSTALQVAAWRGAHDAVQLLVDKGANINAKDMNGNTPLKLAIRACTDSYWMARRKPDSIASLLQAGAGREGVTLPTGYEEADKLLRS